MARVIPAWERTVAGGGTSIVVCHRKPILVVLAHLLGLPHGRAWRLAAAPGSLTQYRSKLVLQGSAGP